MSAREADRLLADLRARGVSLVAEGDDLRCVGPAGVLTDTLVDQVRARKRDLLAVLRAGRGIPRASGSPAMLSYAQERIWLHCALHPGDTAYNLPLRVDLTGPLRPASLRLALTDVLRRHEALRTRYATRRGRPVPVIDPAGAAALPVVDLGVLPAERQGRELDRLAAAEANRPFDLAADPVLRTVLVRLSHNRHSLLVTRHHIASDGWSLGILLGELSDLYRDRLAGRACGLPELAVQYADFAAWQRDPARRDAQDGGLDRWVRRLRGAAFGLDLLEDVNPRAAGGTTESIGLTLPGSVVDSLTRLARSMRVSLFTVLLAGFGWALRRCAGQTDVVVGSPVAGRTRVQLEPIVGCFASMLPLRLDLSGRPSFRRLAARVHEVVQEALDNQETPAEQIVEALRPRRTLRDNPLFAVAFAFQNTPRPRVRLPGLRASVAPPPAVMPKFALELTASERDGRIELSLEFDPARVRPATAERLLTLARRALADAVADPDLPMAGDGGSGDARSAATVAEPVASLLQDLAVAAAARAPDAVAVTYRGAQLSYRALWARAGRLASALRARGAGAEELVALCLEPSLDLVVAALGIVRSGAGYLPIDPADPPERRARICAQAGVRIAVTRPGLLGPAIEQLAVVEPADRPARADPARLPAVVPANTAYTIFTSGSTGDPKGVLVTHANLAGLLGGVRSALPELGTGQVWSMAHSPAFDVSVFEMWAALSSGGRLVVVPGDVTRTPDELWQHLRDEAVTVLSQTPTAFGRLAPVAVRSGTAAALRFILLAGEACDVGSLEGWFAAFGERRPALVNLYGITETTVHATLRPLGVRDLVAPRSRRDSPIGSAIPGQSVWVGPDGGSPPAGGTGELYVGGVGLARGYLGRPGLTAERFVPAGPVAVPGARCYRSGDLARVLPGGEFGYLGRVDDQVKVRGYRIEPGEIEAALANHPAVRTAAVVPASTAGRRYLVGYVVPDGAGGRPREEVLRQHLADRLPPYMVPARLVFLDALPVTRNGKVDRHSLASRALSTPDGARERPGTETERVLATILAELLGYRSADAIGVRDNLFDLGGDSLVVTQFHARIVARFNVDAPVRRIYQALDIASLAATVDGLVADREREAIRRALAEVSGSAEEDACRPD